MKRGVLIIFLLTIFLGMKAQEEQKFSPEKFFPVYREMQNRQRSLFDRQRNLATMSTNDEASCMKAIRERDEIELEMKRIQKTYHERFLELLPASKVYAVLKAEDQFYRHYFRRFNRNRQQFNWPQMPQRQNNQMPQRSNNHK